MIKTNPRTVIDESQDHTLARPELQSVVLGAPSFRIPKFHLNKDRPDSRDYVYAVRGVSNPAIVDLRPYCTPIENQLSLGSCTGQAVAGAIELLDNRDGKFVDVSRLFIYYWERWLMGTINYDSGAYIRDGIKATNRWGACLESLWPYIVSKFRAQPSQPAILDGANRKVTRYERILDIDGCFDALSRGFPVIVGFLVYSSFESRQTITRGIMTYPDVRRERLLGGHAVLLVGYDKTRQVFIARNSWGAGWGDRGYFYMPFRVIQDPAMSFDFWTITGVQNI
jgi:C1A family cysteine protease